MKQDPFKKIIIIDISVAEIVALLAAVAGQRRTIPIAERRALRSITKRLSTRALKHLGKVG